MKREERDEDQPCKKRKVPVAVRLAQYIRQPEECEARHEDEGGDEEHESDYEEERQDELDFNKGVFEEADAWEAEAAEKEQNREKEEKEQREKEAADKEKRDKEDQEKREKEEKEQREKAAADNEKREQEKREKEEREQREKEDKEKRENEGKATGEKADKHLDLSQTLRDVPSPASPSAVGSLATLLQGQEQMLAQTLLEVASRCGSQTESQLLASSLGRVFFCQMMLLLLLLHAVLSCLFEVGPFCKPSGGR